MKELDVTKGFLILQDYHNKFQETVSNNSLQSKNSTNTVKSPSELVVENGKSDQLSNVTSAIQNIDLNEPRNEFTRTRLSSIDELEDSPNEIISPWVRIAHQEYLEKMRQLELSDDVRIIHPAMLPVSARKLDLGLSSLNPSDNTDNTSSAYNTGESFKSSASENSRLNEKASTITATGCNLKHESFSCHQPLTMACSSDANSDGEEPACYLTHNEGSGDSEGFEDARIEFRSVFNSRLDPNRPVPLPRILHPPREATSFLAHSLTASTSNLWKATAAAVISRRKQAHASNLKSNQASKSSVCKHVNWNFSENQELKHSNNETSTTDANDVPLNKKAGLSLQNSSKITNSTAVHKVRRSSDHIRSNMKHPRVKRSVSCTDGHGVSEDNKDAQMEWKVRVSRDGTRYITKRPVRERLLREREKRLLAERCMTTDDDFTELKLGRHWSRDERKRQLRIARDKKRRRELMHRSRMEVLNEITPADGEIVELSQKRMSKQKHKRMLLDNFVTVQELMAHGDRSTDISKINPFLSVTYI